MNILVYLGRLLITVIVITGFAAVPGIGSDTATLEKQIYKEIKQAERMMFSGKKAQADELLKQVAEKLSSLENSTPANKKLTTLNNQYNRTRKNLINEWGKAAQPLLPRYQELVKPPRQNEHLPPGPVLNDLIIRHR